MHVKIQYNPYTTESVIHLGDQEISENSRLYSHKDERIQMWIDKLIPILVDECNDSVLNIDFHGTLLDYNDLEEQVKDYCQSHQDIQIHLVHKKGKDPNDKFSKLRALFSEMQDDCPFEDLKDTHIKENFEKALSSEFEVSVIATMSSGKSTLINAMLGAEIMPAKNEACTATISRIKDVDGQTGFSAIYRNADYQSMGKCDSLDIEIMKALNEDPAISYIDIEGNIPFISSRQVQLVLVDTPGPNNSRNEAHRNHTYRIIKEKSKPMVLYVLNATQLETNDDNYLLTAVAEAMKVGGKQSKDRFIFAINKIDAYDTEKDDSIEQALNNVRTYLAKHGIQKPNIYLTSAEMAKIIRLRNNGQKMTMKQTLALDGHVLFDNDERMHLSKYAPLSPKSRIKMEELMETAQKSDDTFAETLIHTGIPAIEIAINEYLEKYAATAKIKTAVDTFKKKIEEKKIFQSLIESLAHDAKKREKLNTQLMRIEKQLADGKKGAEFKKTIKQLTMDAEVTKQAGILRSKITTTLTGYYKGDNKKMTRMEAEQHLTRLTKKIQELQSDLKTDLDKILTEVIIDNAKRLLQEYENHIQSLIDDNSVNVGTYRATATSVILKSGIPDADDLIDKYKVSENVKVGERYVKNLDKHWYNPFTWFEPRMITESIYEQKEFVYRERVSEEFIRPILGNFYENIENAKKEALTEAKKFKEYFIRELDDLDAALNEKVSNLQKISEDQKVLVKTIKENEHKKIWLEEFTQQLDSILEI